MRLRRKRKSKSDQRLEERRQERIIRIARNLYQNQFSSNKQIDQTKIWHIAEKIANNPLRNALFVCNRPFIKLEKLIWEPILTWADNQALLSLLGVISNFGLIIAVGMYIGSEKQRRDTEVLTAWQTITNAHGQPGNGGRIHALEFLNVSPRNRDYGYPGSNWRRRAICLWICLWPSESLAGIDLSGNVIETSVPTAQEKKSDKTPSNTDPRGVYLARVQLPGADLEAANLERAALWEANLEGADLEAANLERAVLWEANLGGVNLESANLKGANLKSTNLKGANLRSTNLEGVDLGYANLEGVDLGYANLEGANLRSTNLEGANLWEANLEGVDLGYANLEGAVLWHANLEGAFLEAANLERTVLWEANLKGVDLGYAKLEVAALETAKLEVAALKTAKLCRTQLPLNISLDPDRNCKELGINPETRESD